MPPSLIWPRLLSFLATCTQGPALQWICVLMSDVLASWHVQRLSANTILCGSIATGTGMLSGSTMSSEARDCLARGYPVNVPHDRGVQEARAAPVGRRAGSQGASAPALQLLARRPVLRAAQSARRRVDAESPHALVQLLLHLTLLQGSRQRQSFPDQYGSHKAASILLEDPGQTCLAKFEGIP